MPPTTTTPLVSKRELGVVIFVLPARLPPPPPPSHLNASRRWFFHSFDASPTTTSSLAFKREREVVFSFCFDRPPPPPPPSRPNASWRWFLRLFRPPATTTTSLAFKREPEVVFFRRFDGLPLPPPPSRSNTSRRWFFRRFDGLPPPPPPSRPNTSWRWFLWLFQHVRRHHLPRVQTRAGGGYFRRSNATPTATSLASKCEPEVVIFRCFDATQDDWEGHEGGGARGDDDLLVIVPWSSHQRDPLLFVRGFSSMASTKGWCSYHMPPHSIFFSFCSQQYVFRLYTIKIVTTTP
jgi:hypothetical protein